MEQLPHSVAGKNLSAGRVPVCAIRFALANSGSAIAYGIQLAEPKQPRTLFANNMFNMFPTETIKFH